MAIPKNLKANAIGPFGFPMMDSQAFELEKQLKTLPAEFKEHRRTTTSRKPHEVDFEARTDVSWITTECIDHHNDIVKARGMRDSIYRENPIVTWGHNYSLPAVAKNLWIKPKKYQEIKGQIAKTHYPTKPDDWEGIWLANNAINLVHLDLLAGKSIGFIVLKARPPSKEDIEKNPDCAKVRFIIEEWLLLEYALVTIPCNPEALTDTVTKGILKLEDLHETVIKDLNLTQPSPKPEPTPPPQTTVPMLPDTAILTFDEYRKAIEKKVAKAITDDIAKKTYKDAMDMFLGRI